MDDVVEPIVLDATVLSNFASSSTVEQFGRILDHPATVPAVRDELERGRDLHYRFLDEALAYVGDDIPLLSISDDTIDLRSTVREDLDPGEASHFSRRSSTMERSQRMIWLRVGWL